MNNTQNQKAVTSPKMSLEQQAEDLYTIITDDDKLVVSRIPFEGASGPVIRFHNQRDLPWGCLSNFFPAPIIVNGKSYPTSEHFFQSLKFHGKDAEGF